MLIPFLYATSPRTWSLRPVRVPGDQNTRWRLPFLLSTDKRQEFLISLFFPIFPGYQYSRICGPNHRDAAYVRQHAHCHNPFLDYSLNSKFLFLLTSKKNLKQCRFKRHCSPSSPAHAEAGEEGVYSTAFPRSLSLPKPKKPSTTHAPHLAPDKTNRGNKPCGRPWGGCPAASRPPPTPVPLLNRGNRPLSPILFFYKYWHKRGTRGGEIERRKR